MKTFKTYQYFITTSVINNPTNELQVELINSIKSVHGLLVANLDEAKHQVLNAMKSATENCQNAIKYSPLSLELQSNDQIDFTSNIQNVVTLNFYRVSKLGY